MKKATLTTVKATVVGLAGTALTIGATAKVTDAVYDSTNDWSLACSAGTGTALVGMGATTIAAIGVVEHDTKDWTAEDYKDAQNLSKGLNVVTDGLDLMSKALKVASFFSR